MQLRLFLSYLGAVVIFVSASTSAVGAVYKCVDKRGNTAYQAEACNDLDKSSQVEIEKFEKPFAAATKEPKVNDSSSEQNARNEAAERKKKQVIAACDKLKKRYGRDLRQAKSADAARKRAEEQYAKRSSQRDRKMLKTYKKNKRKYKKQLKKSRKADSSYRSSLRASYEVDRVESRYERDKKRMGCDSI